ncbi:SLOG family protein [Streptacidiphilus cavernicola]|uniref:SLOG family protein n=1 Tax=Streptacidiphilus cavernicola TaxID=3342716 RepID=A0ABV6W441_9ACTN
MRPEVTQARIIVTGSRAHTDRDLIRSALALARWDLGPLIVVHGAAPGADSIASEWARSYPHLGVTEERCERRRFSPGVVSA